MDLVPTFPVSALGLVSQHFGNSEALRYELGLSVSQV
jgi:hypothetical protein